MPNKQKITTFLWFDGNAEEAVKFYTSVFPRSKILATSRYSDLGPGPEGSIMTMTFELEGQEFVALNGGPEFKFTEAISLLVSCETQKELDELWSKLTADGGQEVQCGWLKDKFGLSWQIVPSKLMDMVQDRDPEKSKRVMEAVMRMTKLDTAELQRAYDGERAPARR